MANRHDSCAECGEYGPIRARGMCVVHYNAWYWRKNGSKYVERRKLGLAAPIADRRCSVDGCNDAHEAKGYCTFHYRRAIAGREVDAPRRASTGSGTTDADGYRKVYVDGRPRREHRVLMERILGRPLADHEEVHHKNGVRHDNRPENLELWARPQPSGQRVEDLVSWVVGNYADEVRKLLGGE